MATQQTFVEAFNQVVEETLEVAFPPAPYEQLTSVGTNGDPAYIQGNAPNEKVFYSTFLEFDKSVKYNPSSNRWVRDGGSFTDQIFDLYSKIQFRNSYDFQSNVDITNKLEIEAYDKFFKGGKNSQFSYVDLFKPGTQLFDELRVTGRLSTTTQPHTLIAPFYKFTVDEKTNRLITIDVDKDNNIDPFNSNSTERKNAIDYLLTWSVVEALAYPSGLTREGKSLVQRMAKRADIDMLNFDDDYENLSDTDKDIIATDIATFFVSGARDYKTYFANAFEPGSPNPMYTLWDNYVTLQLSVGTLTSATLATLVKRSNQDKASANIRTWLSANEDEISQEMVDNNDEDNYSDSYLPEVAEDQFVEVCETEYDDFWDEYYEVCDYQPIPSEVEDTVVSNFRPTMPMLNSFSLLGSAVEKTITGKNSVGSDIKITVSTENNTANFSSNSSESSSVERSNSASYGWFFSPWGFAGGGGNDSSTTQKNSKSFFSESAETGVKQDAILSYPRSFKQTWDPATAGRGIWLNKSAISDIRDAIDDNILPWVSHPKWPGGFGFQSADEAKRFLKKGFAAPKSLIVSPNPTSTIKFKSNSEAKEDFSSSSFEQKDWSKSRTVGWGTWFFGGYSTTTTTGRDIKESSTTSSSFNEDNNEVTINNISIIPTINSTNNGLPEEYDGYAGQLLAYVSEVLIEPIKDEQRINEIKEAAGLSATASAKSVKGELAEREGDTIYHQEISITKNDTTHYGKEDNTVFCGKGGDVITGGGGDDTIFAEEGNDYVKGGKGSDFISGGKGINKLWGGLGADYFDINYETVMRAHRAHKYAIQRIKDFDASEGDVLWFSADTGSWDESLISQDGNDILYRMGDKDYKIAELYGIDPSLVTEAIDNAVFIN